MIHVDALTKTFGTVTAVSALTFTVQPGVVTGFLGPNGAGKSTTMRMIMGLDRPTSGTATVNGKELHRHAAPLQEIGALIDPGATHPKRSARNHLRVIATTNGIPDSRVDAVLRIVGLEAAADRSAGTFSLGMSQRLGIATALLGDPATIVLDEPVNGLDPEGILWIRGLLKDLAAQGRTVLVSSHLMNEMAVIAEQFIIIGAGHLIADVTRTELIKKYSRSSVFVRSANIGPLRSALKNTTCRVENVTDDAITITGMPSVAIGQHAADREVVLTELTPHESTLEEIFMELTGDSTQYRSTNETHQHRGAA